MTTRSNLTIEQIYRSWEDGESYWNHYLLRKPRTKLDHLTLHIKKASFEIRGSFPKKKRTIANPIIVDTYPIVHHDLFHEIRDRLANNSA